MTQRSHSEMANLGIHFEKWVANLFDELGKLNVKHNVTIKHGKSKSQFDVVYGLLFKNYVECKFHVVEDEKSANKTKNFVPFKDVAIFASKLKLINKNYGCGIIVTNTYFQQRAVDYAKKIGLNLMTRDDLYKFHLRRNGFFKSMFNHNKSLEKIILSYKLR